MAGEAAPAANAPAPSTSPTGGDGGGASATREQASAKPRAQRADPFKAAADDLRERRRLRLAPPPKDSAEVVQPGADVDRGNDPDRGTTGADGAVDDDGREGADVDPNAEPNLDGEDAPHWAKALRAERDDLAQKVKDADERDRKWQEGSRQVKHAHEDAVDEAKFWRAQFDEVRAIMRRIPVRNAQGQVVRGPDGQPIGHDVDANSLRAVMAEREAAKLKRQIERGQGQDVDGLAQKFRAEAQGRFSAVRQKFPTLDPQKHPAARDFLEDELHRWQRTGGKWDGIEERAARVDRAIRAELAAKAPNAQKQRAEQPAKPQGNLRPSAQPRERTQTVEVNGRQMPRSLTDKQIKEEVRQHRLRRRG